MPHRLPVGVPPRGSSHSEGGSVDAQEISVPVAFTVAANLEVKCGFQGGGAIEGIAGSYESEMSVEK